MQNHGGGGGFAMTSTHHNPKFVFGLLKHVFRKRINLETHFQSLHHFRIVFSGMHAQDYGIYVRGNIGFVPTKRFRQ